MRRKGSHVRKDAHADNGSGLPGGSPATTQASVPDSEQGQATLSLVIVLAQQMVRGYGMSELACLISVASRADAPVEAGSAGVPAEVRRLLREAHERAWATLKGYRPQLDRLADRLATGETLDTLDKVEIDRLLADVLRHVRRVTQAAVPA